MKIIKPERREDGIHVEAEMDGEIKKYLFAIDMPAKDITDELEAIEQILIAERENAVIERENNAINEKADDIVRELLSK